MEAGLENTVDTEAIRNPIYLFLPVQCSICQMAHCHNEKGFFPIHLVKIVVCLETEKWLMSRLLLFSLQVVK